MKVKLEDVEIRGFEEKTSNKVNDDGSLYSYLIVRFEDATGKPYEILDRDMARKERYKRGTQGSFYADLRMGKKRDGGEYASLSVLDFLPA